MAEHFDTQISLVHLTIDGKPISVPKGTTVYQAAKQLGIPLPIFCYQDRMPPFGACRVCLVEVENMPKLQTSCTLVATEGMVVKTQTQMAIDGRKGILEFLLINHPLDCPICDRAGECPLQDQTIKYGPGLSRFFEEKRHFQKHVPLGSVLMLDRERCIACARCTRFSDIVAGDHALELFDRGYKIEVGTPNGEPVDSKFIGNTIMICPVGALTSQVYRFRARPWDNTSTQTTCTLCPVGCSMILDSRDGQITRTRSYEMPEVNDIWLCDKGWFGYEFSSHPDRLKTPLVRRDGKLEPATWDEALSLIIAKIKEFQPFGKLAAIGGNTLTVEENYLLQKLMRDVIGVNHLDHRLGHTMFNAEEEYIQAGMQTVIGDCEHLEFIVIFGCDITEEFPVIWLRLKQAINKGAKVIFFGHFAPEISRYFEKVVLHAPGKEIEVIHHYASEIRSLTQAYKKGAFFVGRQYLANRYRKQILQEIHELSQSTSCIDLNVMEGRGNSIGARFAGMHPEFGPLGQKLLQSGFNALQIMEESVSSGWDFVYAVGNDMASHLNSNLWSQARRQLKFLVAQDIFLTKTAQEADVVLPTLSFVEKKGSFINIEHRLQIINPGKTIPESMYSDKDIFQQIAEKLNQPLQMDQHFMQALKPGKLQLNRKIDLDQKIFKRELQKIDLPKNALFATYAYSLFNHGVRMKHNPHLLKLVHEPCIRINSKEAFQRGFQQGSWIKFQTKQSSILAKVLIDEKVADSTVVIPIGIEGFNVLDLENTMLNGDIVHAYKEV